MLQLPALSYKQTSIGNTCIISCRHFQGHRDSTWRTIPNQTEGTVQTGSTPPRSVPIAMQWAYKTELNRLVKEGIITEVKEHTEWINSIVPVMKSNGSLRLCLDPKKLEQGHWEQPVVLKDNWWHTTRTSQVLSTKD